MAMKILADDCTVCGTCEFDCPGGAIGMKGDMYVIDAGKCTECAGVHDAPNCVGGCPADAIVAA